MRQQPDRHAPNKTFLRVHHGWAVVDAAAAVGILALSLIGGGQTVAAVGWSPETCAAERANRDLMVSQPDIFGGSLGKMAIDQANNNLRNLCNDQSEGVPPSDAPNP